MVPSSTTTVDQLRGDILSDAMRKLHENPGRLPAEYHSVSIEPGVAMLVEPVNEAAFVFIPPRTVLAFESKPGSGTDKLRQRMQAGLFFNSVVDNHRTKATNLAAGADRVAAAKRETAGRTGADDWVMVSATALDVGTRLTGYAKLSLDTSQIAGELLTGAVSDVELAADHMRNHPPARLAPSDGLEFVSVQWVRAVGAMSDALEVAMQRDRSLAEDFGVDHGDWKLIAATAPEIHDLLGKHGAAFNTAARGLIEADVVFAAGLLSSIEHSRARETHLSDALVALAAEYGVRLEHPLHIDSRGEFKLVSLASDGRGPEMGCGPFGGFVDVLNRHNPRTGTSPGALLAPENGWCFLNHFDASRLVVGEFHAPHAETAEAGVVAATPKRKARP